LPLSDGAACQIEAYQLVEHFSFVRLLYCLGEWYRVLGPRGKLIIETPDVEASFERYLGYKKRRMKLRTLGWIFGTEQEGFGHRLLYPLPVLKRMLRMSGFTRISVQEPKGHLYENSVRLQAYRKEDSLYLLLSHLRNRLVVSRLFALTPWRHLEEFESEFIRQVVQLEAHLPAALLQDKLVHCLVVSSTAAREYLSLRNELKTLAPFPYQDQWTALAVAFSELRFSRRLFSCFRSLADSSDNSGPGYQHAIARGRGFVQKILRTGYYDLADEFEQYFGDSYEPQEANEKERDFFSRTEAAEYATRLCAQGIKLCGRNRLIDAETAFKKAANLKESPFYPLWNLAVLEVRRGNPAEGVSYYRRAIGHMRNRELKARLCEELIVCLLHQGKLEEAVSELDSMERAPLDNVLRRASRARSRARKLAVFQNAALPSLRTSPVCFGEGTYAAI